MYHKIQILKVKNTKDYRVAEEIRKPELHYQIKKYDLLPPNGKTIFYNHTYRIFSLAQREFQVKYYYQSAIFAKIYLY